MRHSLDESGNLLRQMQSKRNNQQHQGGGKKEKGGGEKTAGTTKNPGPTRIPLRKIKYETGKKRTNSTPKVWEGRPLGKEWKILACTTAEKGYQKGGMGSPSGVSGG